MKKCNKILVAFLAVVFLLVLAPFGTKALAATGDGKTIANAVSVTFGNTNSLSWTSSDSSSMDRYCKIVVPSAGYITFSITSPTVSDGEDASYSLYLYDATGNLGYGNSTKYLTSVSGDISTDIGIKAGTYYLRITPDFYMYSDSATVSAQYSVTYTKASNYEKEPNYSRALATKLELGQSYNAHFGEYASDWSDEQDVYKFSVAKNARYRLYIGSVDEFERGTTIISFYNEKGEEQSLYTWYGLTYDNTREMYYLDYKASAAGTCYLIFYNDMEEDIDYSVALYPSYLYVKKGTDGIWHSYSYGKQTTAAGIAKRMDNNTWWYVKNGRVQTGVTSVEKRTDNSTWWYVKKGKVQTSTTGLVKRTENSTWWYVKNGKVDFTYTGLVSNSSGKWYVKKGQVQMSYTGYVTIGGKKYHITKGKVK